MSRIVPTQIPGLLVLELDVRPDSRGWFEEVWHREKLTALGLPDFGPVQSNVSWNADRGTTRGIHAEPWDKLVTVVGGRAFGAWVDLRPGATYGQVVTQELEPGVAVFVPRGVGNSFQTLEPATAYLYLINEHWRPDARYPALRLDDPTVAIDWPIPLADAVISEKDRANHALAEVPPPAPPRVAVLGSRGRLGRALVHEFPDCVESTDDADVILNAAAYTDVDGAETEDGRVAAWAANAALPAELARLATERRATLVHFSTDYVFDGRRAEHDEDEPLSPLGVYAQTKAAGDLAVATTPRHYLLRTSWLVGDGDSFVRTMLALAARGERPEVVDDQVGRLTFASELARATRHLLDTGAPYGTYNVTNGGTPCSWASIAAEVFALSGRDPADVVPVSSQEYARGRRIAPRPRSSVLDLARLRATGFEPEDHLEALRSYVAEASSRP